MQILQGNTHLYRYQDMCRRSIKEATYFKHYLVTLWPLISCAVNPPVWSLGRQRMKRNVCFMFVNCGSLYNLVNKANFLHDFSWYVYFFSLHVSGDYVPSFRRNNCICVTPGTCYSIWMTI